MCPHQVVRMLSLQLKTVIPFITVIMASQQEVFCELIPWGQGWTAIQDHQSQMFKTLATEVVKEVLQKN